MVKLTTEHDKLKYRINILENSVKEEKSKSKSTSQGGKNPVSTTTQAKPAQAATSNMPRQLSSKPLPAENQRQNYSLSITDTLFALFDRAIQAKYPSLSDAAVIITNSKVADYQCNSAMSISQV